MLVERAEASKPLVPASISRTIETLTVDTYGWVIEDGRNALTAVGVAIALYVFVWGARWALARALGADHPVTTWRGFLSRIVSRTRSPFIAIASVYVVTHLIAMPAPLQRLIDIGFTIGFAVQGAIWLREVLLAMVDRRTADSENSHELASAVGIIRVMVNIIVWILAAILILDNLGVNVTALVAGLGVGGIAIGLAAQGILGDLFAALAILFDRPFKVGDTISFGGMTGTVEAIGLKTTRIRALSGEQVVVSNAKLLDQQISNLRRIQERRVVMQIGVIYQTSPALLARIPAEIEAIVSAEPHCRFDRVHFWNFGQSSLDFEIVFHVEQPDHPVMMAARHNIGIAMVTRFAALDIQFAYPTQTSFTAAPDGSMIDPRERLGGEGPTPAEA